MRALPVAADAFPAGKQHHRKSAMNTDEDFDIAAAYNTIRGRPSAEEPFEKAEAKICSFMEKHKVKKLKFLDGEVYELKLLKTPKLHFELRRSK